MQETPLSDYGGAVGSLPAVGCGEIVAVVWGDDTAGAWSGFDVPLLEHQVITTPAIAANAATVVQNSVLLPSRIARQC